MQYYLYGKTETDYLKLKDPALGAAIEKIGEIEREVDADLFSSLISSIVGQQISSKAAATVWLRVVNLAGEVTPQSITNLPIDELQACGMSMRKAGYIKNAAEDICGGKIDLEHLHNLSDDEICKQLVSLKGVGVWTAEMLMIFSMQRPDILSFGDLAILRGMRMLYNLPAISKAEFAKYREVYSPYATVASLYLWAVAGGALPDLVDPAVSLAKGER